MGCGSSVSQQSLDFDEAKPRPAGHKAAGNTVAPMPLPPTSSAAPTGTTAIQQPPLQSTHARDKQREASTSQSSHAEGSPLVRPSVTQLGQQPQQARQSSVPASTNKPRKARDSLASQSASLAEEPESPIPHDRHSGLTNRAGLSQRRSAALPPLKGKSLPPIKTKGISRPSTINTTSASPQPNSAELPAKARRSSSTLLGPNTPNDPQSANGKLSPLSPLATPNQRASVIAAPPSLAPVKTTKQPRQSVTASPSQLRQSVMASPGQPLATHSKRPTMTDYVSAQLKLHPSAWSSPALMTQYPDAVFEHYAAFTGSAESIARKSIARLAKDACDEWLRCYKQNNAQAKDKGKSSAPDREALRSLAGVLGVDARKPEREQLDTVVTKRLRTELRVDDDGSVSKLIFTANYKAAHTKIFGSEQDASNPLQCVIS